MTIALNEKTKNRRWPFFLHLFIVWAGFLHNTQFFSKARKDAPKIELVKAFSRLKKDFKNQEKIQTWMNIAQTRQSGKKKKKKWKASREKLG